MAHFVVMVVIVVLAVMVFLLLQLMFGGNQNSTRTKKMSATTATATADKWPVIGRELLAHNLGDINAKEGEREHLAMADKQ